jgi:hypothetical protein
MRPLSVRVRHRLNVRLYRLTLFVAARIIRVGLTLNNAAVGIKQRDERLLCEANR